jgi:hypothetical protein
MRLRNTIGILPCDVASHKIRKDMLESSAGVECRSMVLCVSPCPLFQLQELMFCDGVSQVPPHVLASRDA